MTQPSLPVLFLSDLVVLPGMVVPIALDEAAQAAVDAARASSDGELLLAPRLEDRYASYGVVATVERVGRLMRRRRRRRCCGPAAGPASAAASPVPAPRCGSRSSPSRTTVSEHARELAEEYKRLVVAVLQRREAWQVIDTVHQMTDPSAIADAAGYAPYLSDEQKRELLETPDVEQRLETADRVDPRPPRRGGDHRQDRRGRPRGHGEDPARVPAAPAARRDPQGARRGRARGRRRLPRPGRGRRRCPTTSARPRSARSTSSSAPATRTPRPRWIRTWLDTVLELPWGITTDDSTDVAAARERAGRRPPRPRRGQGAHRRVPRGPRPPRRARPAGRSAAAAPAP